MWKYQILKALKSWEDLGIKVSNDAKDIKDAMVFHIGDLRELECLLPKCEIAVRLPYSNMIIECFDTEVTKEKMIESKDYAEDELLRAEKQIKQVFHISVKKSIKIYLYEELDSEWTCINWYDAFDDMVHDSTGLRVSDEEFNVLMKNRAGLLAYLLTMPNVRTREIEVASPSVNCKRIRKGKLPLYSYHIVEIAPFRDKPNHWIRLGTGELKQRAHLCRGHYRVYTPEKPMFGKYAGVFFIHAHGRGDPGLGIVDKEYVVVE